MGKRKAAVSLSDSDDDEEHHHRVGESESPERPLQTARRSGKKSKVRSVRRLYASICPTGRLQNTNDLDESEEETLKSAKKPKVAAKPSVCTLSTHGCLI